MKKVGRKVVSVLLTLCMLLTMLPVSALAVDEGTVVDTAPAETNLAAPANNGNSSSDDSLPVSTLGTDPEGDADVSVEYVDENKVARTCTDYTVVTSSDTDWSAGWYVVTGAVDLTDRVQVSGNVHLILTDGAALNAENGGIGVRAGNRLTIYGQSAGTGTLTARAYQVRSAAAIGGNDDSGAHGDITINGGDITATGASAGIGGGESATGTSGTITINGGTVKATGGSDAAGIGGGYANTTNGGAIIINGGTVTATGGSKAAGIGAGYSGAGGMEITITGGKVTATGGSNDTYGGAGIGANYGGSTNPVSITITGSADVTATGGLGAAGIGGGSGNAEAAVDTIVIDGSAKVHATGGNQDTYAGAGIGAGGKGNCGSITIGGDANVTAIGGTSSSYSGAGIGAGGGNGGVDYVEGEVVITPTCNKINITGGTVDATGGTGADGIGGNASSTVESVSISGGTFTANTFPNGEIPADYLAAGFAPVKDSNGNWSVKEKEETPPAPTGVAQIGDKTYPTLEEAFAAVESSGTIKLLADTGISNTITISASQSIVLDLNGNTITELGEATRKICNNGTLTIRTSVAGGTLKNKDAGSYGLIDNYGTLTIESGTFENYGRASGAAIKNRPGAELLKIEGGEFKGLVEDPGGDQNGYATAANVLVASEAPLTITGGDFSSRAHYSAVFKIFADTADISNVTVSTYMAGGIEVAGGNAVLKDCSFHVSEENSYYANAVAVSGGGTATIDGGTYTGYKYAAYVYNSGGTINIEGGTFGAETVLKADNSTTSNKSVINVTKGDFTGNIAIGNQSTLAISGGTFSVEIPEEYCAEGFVPQKNADDTWGVVAETTYVAQIGETEYATLSEALNKVRDGETIKVLAPATVDTAVTYEITGKTITLNLNGQTVAWNTSAKEAITVKDSGSLTIQDTSANEAGELAFTSTYTAAGDSTGIYVNLNGALTLQSGTISYTAAKNGRAIYVGGTCTFAMSGGTVEIAGSAKYGVYLSSNNSTNITGGKIILSDTLTGTTLYGLYVYMLAEAQGLAIENLTVDASAVPVAQCAYCISGGWNNANNAPVTISGGTYTTNENTLSKAIYYSTVKNLTISGGTFNGVVDSATSITDGTFQKAVEVTDTITGGTFEGNVTAPSGKISGGKFKVVDPPYYWNLADGKSFEQKDGYYCVVDDTSGVAQIGNQKYETLEAAINAAQNGDTVKLIADVSMQDGILLDKGADIAITLDLNGYTYTVQEGANVSNRGFKINSGTLNVIDSSEARTGEMVAVGSGTTSADGAGAYGVFRVEANGHLNVTDVTLRNSRPWGLNVKICGGTATLTDVEIISSYGGGIEVTEANLGEQSQKGQATMTNCTVTQTGYFDHCSSAVSVSGGSKLIVDGGTYTSDGVAIYVFSSGGEIEVIDGTFSGEKQVIRAEIDTSTYPEYTGGVQIKGGSYTGNLAITSPASLAVSGGIFSVEISEEYCAEGFKPEKNDDGTWGVVEEDTAVFASGSGTAEDPYIIMNATQLGRFRDSVNSGTNYSKQYIKLGADIDLSGVENWEPIGNSTNKFHGIFDGTKTTDEDGNVTETYIISNLTINRPSQKDVGLFGFTTGGEVKNFTLNNANVTGYLDVGAVAGTPYTSKYTNINVTGTIQVNGFSYVGGAFGKNAYANITDVDVTGDTSSYVKAHSIDNVGTYRTYVGGLVGFMGEGNITVSDCDVKIDVTGSTGDIGGILGILHYGNTLKNCTYVGSLTLTTPNTNVADEFGALVGTVYNGSQNYTTTIANCTATVNKALSGTENVTDTITAHGDFYNSAYGTDKVSIGAKVNGKVVDLYNRDVAKIGDISYNSLVSAVEAAKPGDTITLLGDIDLIPVDIPTENGDVHPHIVINKNLTLDLAGYKIAWDERYHEDTFECTLLIINITDGAEVTITGNGTIDTEAKLNNSYGIELTEGSKLTIENGTFTGATTAVQVTEGKLTILDGTFIQAKTIAQFAPNYAKYVVNAIDANWADGTADISIQGGSFCFDPSDKPENSDRTYVAEGFEAVLNEDGTWGVAEATTYVAEIVDGQKYESLIEAVEAATAGQTVKLLANVELQPVENQDYVLMIDANQSMTLDLNGHKITATLNNTAEFNLIDNYGELTITDTSEGKGGSIEVTENGFAEKSRTSVIYNGYSSGKFTLEAGTLKLTGSEGSKKPLYGVYSSGTTVVMNGGAIEVRRLDSTAGTTTEAWDVYGIYNRENSQTTVNGGKITVENQGWWNTAYGIYGFTGTTSIRGNADTPEITAIAEMEGTQFAYTVFGTVTLYGGKYDTPVDDNAGWGYQVTIADGYEKRINTDGTVSVVKSPVAQIGSTKYDTLEEALKEAKSGDTIKLLQNVALTDRVIISKNITLNLNDKTISSTADYAFIVNTGNSFTLENGTLSAYQNGVFGLTSSTVTLASDATINAGAAGITATNNLLEQGNATINVYGTIHSQDIAVWSQGPKNTINIDSATITSKYFGVYQNGSYGGTTITIKNSTITDESENGTGIYVSNNGTNAENPDQGFQNLIIENSTITGNTAVEVKFTNVTISGDDTCLTATGTPVDSGMNNNGSVTTGYAFAVTHNGTESSKDAAKGTVTISGGKFTGAVGIQEPSEGETTSATISISGGSFSEEPKDDYLAPYYDATKGDGDTYWTVDVAADVEAIWITDTDTKAGMLSDLLTEATSGTVQLLKDVEAGNVTSTYPVTLDLNGNTLETTALALFDGAVVDSTEGEGLLKVGVTRNTPNITLKENNPSLFIYDSEAAGYRLYSYTFEKLRAYTTDQSGNSMGFYFQLTFENLAAWGKLNTAETTHGVIMSTVLGLPNGTELIVYFDQSTIQGVAGSIVGGAAQTGKGFWLTVTGLNKLEAGQTLKVTPTLEAAGDNLVINTEAFEYSKSADESN